MIAINEIKFCQGHVQIKNGQVMKLKRGYTLFCFNLRKTGVIRPNMIHCVSKLLLGSQHHPAFTSKQSLIDNKKHAKPTGPLL